jgi:hypothetical protein
MRQEVETQAQKVLNLGLDHITKFVCRLDKSLDEVNVEQSNSECVYTG